MVYYQLVHFGIFISLIFFYFSLSGQIDLQTLSRQNGMLDNEINWYVYQDSKSLIWISCATGVSVYDGTSFQNFVFNDPTSNLKGTSVQSGFFEDSHSNIWFTTYEYLVQYDRIKNTFVSHTIKLDKKPISAGYHLYKLDTLNNIKWLKCGNDLINIKENDISNPRVIIKDTKSMRFLNIKSSDTTTCILGFPWVISQGLELYEISKLGSSQIPISQEHVNSLTFRGGDHIQNKTYLFSDKGIIKYDSQNSSFSSPIQPPKWMNETPSFTQYGASFFLNNSNVDVLQFDTQTESFNSIINKHKLEIPLTQLPVLNTIGQHLTYSINGSSIKFHKIVNNDDSNFTELNSNVVEFFEDYKFQFISTMENIIRLNNNNKQLNTYGIPDVQRIFKINQTYYCYTKDKIFRYDSTLDNWKSIFEIDNKFIKDVYISNDFYLSTLKGIIDFKEVNGALTEMPNKFDSLCYSNLIKLDKKEFIYVLDELKICHSKNDITTCVSNNSVITNLTFIDELNKYFVLSDNGLYNLDLRDSTIHLDKLSPLNNVSNVLYADNKLWIASNSEIYKYDLKNDRILGRLKLNNKSSSKTPLLLTSNNTILIGTDSGYYNYNPEDIPLDKTICDINIFQIQINNTDFIASKSYNYIDHIDLNYLQNNILFEPHVITIESPNEARIKYILGGHENEWKTINNGEEIKYSNLAFGTYDLTMIPISSAYVEGHPKTISITISPPFYQSWWFLLSVAGGLIGIGWYISHTLTKRKLKEVQIALEKQQALSAQREKIADDLHDELGTELNKILYLSDEAIYEKDKNEKENILDNIGKLASESIHNMRDILWVLDNENDTLDSLIARTKVTLQKSLSVYKIRLISSLPDDIPMTAITAEIRRHVLLIVKEACHNVIKHADANKVKLTVDIDSSTILIIIKDDGKGITKERTSDNFGLSSMEKRAKAIGGKLHIYSEPGEGVGVTLEIQLDKMTTTNDT